MLWGGCFRDGGCDLCDDDVGAEVFLGQHLAPESGTRVLILIPPELKGVAPDSRAAKAINGLRAGLGSAVEICS